MRALSLFRVLLLSLLALAVGCGDEGQMIAPDTTTPDKAALQLEGELTPLQQRIRDSVDQQIEAGLPAPVVQFEYVSDNGSPLSALRTRAGQPGESFTIVATTVLEFSHPREAGLDRWPPMVVSGSVPAEDGFIREGDYTQAFRDYVEERSPGIWDTYEFGTEPRTQTITETFTVTYPTEAQSKVSTDDDLVHGLTITGPDIDWTVENDACIVGEICAWEFKAGLEIDWGFGIRLPMNVAVDTSTPVDEGDTFSVNSMAQGVDWSAADYTAAGIEPESGNEFVMRFTFFLGVQVKIAEITVLSVGPDIDEDESSSFATPFGPGAVFNLPTIDAPIYAVSVSDASASFGAAITPQAGSDLFEADWEATNDLSGSGMLNWTDPNANVLVGSVQAIDGPSIGNLQIKDSKYVFTQFKIALGAYFEIDIFGLYTNRYEIPITDFDLSDLIPDISVPIHAGASPTTLNSGVTVNNVAPTAVLDVSGADVINGVDTFFADEGEPIPFQGSSHDPGRDDLTLAWDFGDGAPAPDKSTNYPLAGDTGPNDVTENQPWTYDGACLYQVTFRSTDSDGGFSEDTAAVVIRPGGDPRARLAGYWQHQFRGNGRVDYSEGDLECLLEIVGFMSNVFDEARDASSVDMAHDVTFLNGNHGSEIDKLDRELLVAWMNFAIGAIDLSDPVDTDGDTLPDTTVEAALTAAETVRLDPNATDAALQMQREIVHAVSSQGTGPVLTSSMRATDLR